MYICICICVYTYICMYVYMCIHIHICIYICRIVCIFGKMESNSTIEFVLLFFCRFVLQCETVQRIALLGLQYVAACCSTLQRVAVRCSALQRVAARCSTLPHVAARRSALQHVAATALQRVAECCNVLQCDWLLGGSALDGFTCVAMCCSVLRRAACCRVLQCA